MLILLWVQSCWAVPERLWLAVFSAKLPGCDALVASHSLITEYSVSVLRSDLWYVSQSGEIMWCVCRGQSASLKQPRLWHHTAFCKCQPVDLPLCFSCANAAKMIRNRTYMLLMISWKLFCLFASVGDIERVWVNAHLFCNMFAYFMCCATGFIV